MIRMILMVLLLFPLAAQAEERTLKVVRYTEDIPPWYFVAADGSLSGAAVEMVNLLAGEAGLDPCFLSLPWSRGLHYLHTGDADLMLHLSKTPERQAYIRYLGVMGEEQPVLLLGPKHRELHIEEMDDLARPGMKWGIEQDFFYAEAFNGRLLNDGAFRAYFFSNAAGGNTNFERVRLGWLTGMIGDRVLLRHALRQLPGGQNFTLLSTRFFPKSPIYFGISRRMPQDKAARLQAAYDTLSSHHAFQTVLERWGCLLQDEDV